jgi:hypothetical protein
MRPGTSESAAIAAIRIAPPIASQRGSDDAISPSSNFVMAGLGPAIHDLTCHSRESGNPVATVFG